MGATVKRKRLKCPWPAFGGKSKVAAAVWGYLGDCSNYIEPFANSAAVLLARPHWHQRRVETINDLDCMTANAWRAIKFDPDAVVRWCDNRVDECDLHSSHRFLVGVEPPQPDVPAPWDRHPTLRRAYLEGFGARSGFADRARSFRERMRTDPFYFDPVRAGLWIAGACSWIGGGWCSSHGETADGDRKQVKPEIRQNGKGVTCLGQLPMLTGDSGASGRGVHSGNGKVKEQIPLIEGHYGSSGRGVHAPSGSRDVIEQIPSAEMCSTGGKGVHGIADVHEKRPRSHSECYGGGGRLPGVHDDTPERRPIIAGDNVGSYGKGIHAGGHPQLADAYDIGRGVHSRGDIGTCEARRRWLLDWFRRLCDRMRTVRVCCGGWERVCTSESVTTRLGLTGVFFDAPYKHTLSDGSRNRSGGLYSNDSTQDVNKLVDDVIAYCVERGGDPMMRIVACAFEGEGYEVLLDLGWTVTAWRAGGGYGSRNANNKNRDRERMFISPHCLKPGNTLFD